MIINEFKYLVSISKDDFATQFLFEHLLDCENTPIFAAYQSDVESLFVFVYDIQVSIYHIIFLMRLKKK